MTEGVGAVTQGFPEVGEMGLGLPGPPLWPPCQLLISFRADRIVSLVGTAVVSSCSHGERRGFKHGLKVLASQEGQGGPD